MQICFQKDWIGNEKKRKGIAVKRVANKKNKKQKTYIPGKLRKKSAYSVFKSDFLGSEEGKSQRTTFLNWCQTEKCRLLHHASPVILFLFYVFHAQNGKKKKSFLNLYFHANSVFTAQITRFAYFWISCQLREMYRFKPKNPR